jgi:hypothetical protein
LVFWEQFTVHLSPSANYEIRRILKDYVKGLDISPSQILRVSESVNFDRLLRNLYPRKFELVSRVRNLEMLADLYRQMSSFRSAEQVAREELQRRIFQILGIGFGLDDEKIPAIVLATDVRIFPFFSEGAVREAMTFRHKFYGKIDEAPVADSSELYKLAILLLEKGFDCLIVSSPGSYSLWVLLRSPVYRVFLRSGLKPFQKAVLLNSVLSRFKQTRFTVY